MRRMATRKRRMTPLDVISRRQLLDQRRCGVGLGTAETEGTRDEARAFRALGDETRVRIVRLLADHADPVCVCQIEAAFSLAQPTISHHLRVLRQAELVTTERRGVWVYYRLNRERFEVLHGFIAAVR